MKTNSLALFDFDGTITNNDSLDCFFRYISPNKFNYYKIKYISTLLYYILFKLNIISLNNLKLKRINKYFLLLNNKNLLDKANIFSQNIVPNSLKKAAINKIKFHKNNNHDVVIVSASLNILLKDFTNKYNIDLITNDILFDTEKKEYYFQKYDCNFDEKVKRIKEKYDLTKYNDIYAYGDSNGDLQMLEIANFKFFNYFK